MVRRDIRRSTQYLTSSDHLRFLKEEAARCIQCNEPNCISGCPYGVNIPTMLLHASFGDFEKARFILADPKLLDLSRSCLAERPCEKSCTLAKKGKPVSIHQIEILLLKEDKKV
ncbi:MAG: hypothetical protein ACP5KV_02915 [Candidatus Methanomethylicaceae archaeon]